MIAHVAEAAEASGRVLLWLDPSSVTTAGASLAAVRVAAAYAAEIETIVVDGPCAGDVGDIPTARVAFARSAAVDPDKIALAEARTRTANAQRRTVEQIAARHCVALSHASAGGDAVDTLAEMCLARGPWNIVAVARPASAEMPGLIGTILANVSGATGVVVAGRRADTHARDVAVVIEDAERMPSMLRAAERLAGRDGLINVAIAAETASSYSELDGLVRLATADYPRCRLLAGGPDFGVTGTLDETLFRLAPGFVIARFGGNLLGEPRALTRLLALTPAPFLLVR